MLTNYVEHHWTDPDESLWEVRAPRRHFTHSRVMAWVAVDRAVKAVEQFGTDGPVERWRRLREAIHDDVCRRGYDAERNTFVQSYGSRHLDASLLMIPLVGFLPAHDPRVQGTVEAVQRHLCRDGFVLRYDAEEGVDGLPGGEGTFLLCTFWLVDNLALAGRVDEARSLFTRLLDLCNDVGLLSEQYDTVAGRLVGNFPQAFTHIGLINSARNLTEVAGPARSAVRSRTTRGGRRTTGRARPRGRRAPSGATPCWWAPPAAVARAPHTGENGSSKSPTNEPPPSACSPGWPPVRADRSRVRRRRRRPCDRLRARVRAAVADRRALHDRLHPDCQRSATADSPPTDPP